MLGESPMQRAPSFILALTSGATPLGLSRLFGWRPRVRGVPRPWAVELNAVGVRLATARVATVVSRGKSKDGVRLRLGLRLRGGCRAWSDPASDPNLNLTLNPNLIPRFRILI